jgi:uncharacterized cupin superfamily protein
MPNIERPDWDEVRDEAEGFHALRARLGHQLGTEHLGLSLWELPPGQAAYPYHVHLAEEEALVVLAGRPSLRTPDGWRDLEQGDVVSFPIGAEGAHQVVNPTDQPVRFLAVSTHGQPDIVLYPDSGKVGPAERLPRGGGFRAFFRLADQVDYWEGEEPPER